MSAHAAQVMHPRSLPMIGMLAKVRDDLAADLTFCVENAGALISAGAEQ